MAVDYLSRTLIQNLGLRDQRTIEEIDIPSIESPIIILGDPGLGKTELTKHLAREFGYIRVAAGTFYRTRAIDRLKFGRPES